MSGIRQGILLTARTGEAARAHGIAVELQRRLGNRDIVVQGVNDPDVEEREVHVLLDMGRREAEEVLRETLGQIDEQWNEAFFLE